MTVENDGGGRHRSYDEAGWSGGRVKRRRRGR